MPQLKSTLSLPGHWFWLDALAKINIFASGTLIFIEYLSENKNAGYIQKKLEKQKKTQNYNKKNNVLGVLSRVRLKTPKALFFFVFVFLVFHRKNQKTKQNNKNNVLGVSSRPCAPVIAINVRPKPPKTLFFFVFFVFLVFPWKTKKTKKYKKQCFGSLEPALCTRHRHQRPAQDSQNIVFFFFFCFFGFSL